VITLKYVVVRDCARAELRRGQVLELNPNGRVTKAWINDGLIVLWEHPK
jgi:putative hemolysin